MDFAAPALVELGLYLRGERYAFYNCPHLQRTCMRCAASMPEIAARRIPDGIFRLRMINLRERRRFSKQRARCSGTARSCAVLSVLRARAMRSSSTPAIPRLATIACSSAPTYRFVRALSGRSFGRVVDVGTGSGAAGILCSAHASEVVLADINPAALRAARTNLALNGAHAEIVHSDITRGRLQQPSTPSLPTRPSWPTRRAASIDGGGAHRAAAVDGKIAHACHAARSYCSGAADHQRARVLAGHSHLCLRRACTRGRTSDPAFFGEELGRPGYAGAASRRCCSP